MLRRGEVDAAHNHENELCLRLIRDHGELCEGLSTDFRAAI
jgi:hypothetical protein